MPKAKAKGFSIKTGNSKILRTCIEALASVIDETKIKITPQEFSITAMDSSRISLLRLTLNKSTFDEYNCSSETQVCVNLEDLNKILKRSDAKDTLTLEYAEKDQKIKIKMNREETTRARTFSLAILDSDIEEIPMDNLLKIEYPSTWSFDPEFLIEAIKDAEIYAEIINIKATEQGIYFDASGQIGEMTAEILLEDLVEQELKGSNLGSYSLTFLKAILKLSSITEQLKISLKTDHPLKMVFNFLEGGILSYFLAPRVEEADFDEDEDLIEGENFTEDTEPETPESLEQAQAIEKQEEE